VSIEEMKQQIDAMSYHEMLSRWRNAPIGSPWFAGEVGDYFSKAMAKKKSETSHAEQVATSKAIGW